MEVFRLFATPLEGDYSALTCQLASNQYFAFCKRYLKVEQQFGLDPDPVITSIMQNFADITSNRFWTPEASVVFPALTSKDLKLEDLSRIRAQLTIAAHICGLTQEMKLETEGTIPLQLKGKTFYQTKLIIHGSQDKIEVFDDKGQALLGLTVVDQYDGGPIWADDALPNNYLTVEGKPLIWFVGDDWDKEWGEEPPELYPVDDKAKQQLQESLEFLNKTYPEYYKWVLCLLKEITLTKRPAKDMIASNSSAVRWGGISLAVPASPTETIEMLVHECTHQYFHMLSWLGGLTTPDAPQFYSILKKRDRPLDRILLGYHAFGNACIVFNRLEELGFGNDIIDRKSTVHHYMQELVVPLENQALLSDLGKALFTPLKPLVDNILGVAASQ